MDETNWEAVRSLAAIVSALCAIVAALVSVSVYRKARTNDHSSQISAGDDKVKQHADRVVDELRRTTADKVEGIEETVGEILKQQGQLQANLARVENDTEHMLRPRDLGRVHEKINAVATDAAATRATVDAVKEQVGVIYSLLIDKKGAR